MNGHKFNWCLLFPQGKFVDAMDDLNTQQESSDLLPLKRVSKLTG